MLLAACDGRPLQDALQTDPNLRPETSAEPPRPAATCSEIARSRLPEAFPSGFCYPEADLLQVTESTLDNGTAIEARWSTEDDAEQVQSFYREAFEQENWEVTTSTDVSATAPIEAVKDGVRVAIAIPAGQSEGAGAASFTVSYRPSQTAQVDEEPVVATAPAAEGAEGNASETSADEPASSAGAARSFTDADDAPEELRDYVRDLASLGVLDAAEGNQFQPNEPVTRRTFARWLFNANNRLYTEPSKRIRIASGSDAVFQDVPQSNPDFGKIQGLADAGLVPSALSGATAVSFRPDAPMTRETLVQWKVPLDLRQSLPNATLDAVQQAWGFQDAAKIEPKALQAVLADYANGDQSNIRRAFGFTTLFQPKKPVTRAEAAAVLWHFGYQGEGRSAGDVLQGAGEEAETEPETSEG